MARTKLTGIDIYGFRGVSLENGLLRIRAAKSKRCCDEPREICSGDGKSMGIA